MRTTIQDTLTTSSKNKTGGSPGSHDIYTMSSNFVSSWKTSSHSHLLLPGFTISWTCRKAHLLNKKQKKLLVPSTQCVVENRKTSQEPPGSGCGHWSYGLNQQQDQEAPCLTL